MNASLLSLMLAAGLSAGSAQAANVIDFGFASPETAVCSSTVDGLGAAGTCSDWSYLHQSYGDIAGVVNVTYSAPRLTDTSMRWWSNDYNNLYGVAWADTNDSDSKARIDIVALQNGMGITLTHLDLGAYPNATLNTSLTITDLANNQALYSFSGAVGVGNIATSFDFNLSSTAGIRIEWADSAYNVGIDNITYAVTAVPEPETYALMLVGLGLVGFAARRKCN